MLTLLLFNQVTFQLNHYPNHDNEIIIVNFILAVEISFFILLTLAWLNKFQFFPFPFFPFTFTA